MTSQTIALGRDSLHTTLRDGFVARGLSLSDSDYIAADLVAAEVEGKRTHGIIKFHDVCSAIPQRIGPPTIVRSDGPTILIDGQRELGHLVARRMVELALSTARDHGVAVIGARNYSYYGRIAQYVRAIAREGFVAIMLNSAGPAAVIPFGGRIPVFGTNPLAFGFPRLGRTPLAIDMATSAEVWGQIALAKAGGGPLPNGAFTDNLGDFTIEPDEAVGVLPFGGAKGSALALAVEVLGGALTSMPTGLRVADEYDLGALLLVIDPDRLGGAGAFASEVTKLSADIEESSGPTGSARVPGDAVGAQDPQQDATVVIDEALWRSIRQALDD